MWGGGDLSPPTQKKTLVLTPTRIWEGGGADPAEDKQGYECPSINPLHPPVTHLCMIHIQPRLRL